ncbi:MAG: competence/damage-inducible protein A [Vicinamibacterales bacterium]
MTGAPPPLRAAILAVGSELLGSTRVDTNSLVITAMLDEIGIEVVYKSIVGDDRVELAAHVRTALDRTDLLIVTGGLGPTDDDLTREVVADVLQRPLEDDAEILQGIRHRFEARGLRMPDVNRRQARVPRGATVLPNPNGTAPGLWLEEENKGIALLPGPPREMKPMLEQLVAGRLVARAGEIRLRRRVIKIAGRTESRVEELTQPRYSSWLEREPPVQTTILAAPGQIELHLSARGTDVVVLEAALEGCVGEIEELLSKDIISTDGRTLEEVVGGLLRAKGWRIALAESCTGGLATSRLTDVSGSSAYVEQSFVTYSDRAKVDLLAVPEALIRTHGAVSEPVATQMARGARTRAGVDVGVGITGIAGPTGGSEQKPVGTVCIAVCAPELVVRTFRFLGGRETVKLFAAHTALDMVRRTLLGAASDQDWIKR